MSEKQSVSIGGKTLYVGTTMVAKENMGRLKRGSEVSIRFIGREGGGSLKIGLVSKKPIEGWHDLNGMCASNRGYWVEPAEIKHSFKITESMHVVRANVSFKKKELKGMECNVLTQLPKSKVFVELAENVGGASCDGLGKKGHCVVLHKDHVGPMKAKKFKLKEREV